MIQPVALWVRSMFRGMFTVFSGGAVMTFRGYDRPMEFFLARDWYLVGKDIVPGIRRCEGLEPEEDETGEAPAEIFEKGYETR